MATITSASLDELLKRLYASWEIEQLVNVTYPVLADCFAEGTAQLGGSGFYFPVRTKMAEGHAYISEDDDLPSGRQSEVLQAVASPTVQAGVVQLTGLSKAISQRDPMAFARAFDENVRTTIEAMSAYKEGVGFRDGSGILATFAEAGSSSTGPFELSDVGFLRPGMVVDIIDTGDNTRHFTGVEIAEVDWVNKEVTFGSNISNAVQSGDEIYLAGSQASTGAPVVKEPIGLEGSIAATGNYLGINRSNVGPWQANVIDVSGFLDEEQLLRARTLITQKTGIPLAGISKRFKAVTHPQQVDVLFKLAMSRIRYSGNDRFDLGNSDEVYFGNIPFKTSYLCPVGTGYLGDWKYSQALYAPNGKLHVDTEYNGASLKWVATKDVGLAFLKEYCQFVVKRPNAFVRFDNLTQLDR